jgi:dihydrofolate synthase/folylpolyglutamate synthase
MVSDRGILYLGAPIVHYFDGVGIVNYKEALNYLQDTLKFGIKPGLENINSLLRVMGDPHKKLKYVHVAGTNGKGSTAAFISSILAESGYRVGIFTSPSLQRFTERIKINSKEISEDELADLTGFVRKNVNELIDKGGVHPTEFEIVTAIAFEFFFRKECDIVVLEVGLGGRFDSTNVIDNPMVSVITTIGYDHMNILGDTLEKIAFEKAGIIKPHSDVVLYPQVREVEKVFESVCRERNAVLHKLEFDDLKIISSGMEGQTFDWRQYKGVRISMLGDYQTGNAVMAIKLQKF